jgi:hypothetical protein
MKERFEHTPLSLVDLETSWSAREAHWARRLGRLRLRVEPIEEQLARIRRVTVVNTAVCGFLSVFLFILFVAFRRPDIGFTVAVLLFVPIAGGAWLGFYRLERRAMRYLAELEAYKHAKEGARAHTQG